ncbi:MAG: hypothetical protein NC923_00230 [Candidatus Omnitrophica bacterium]|nr:hypothetical protein [Candidatus Omnitrophota bacterium]
MHKDIVKNIIIFFLLAIASFSVYKYIAILKEKQDLKAELSQANSRIAVLAKETTALKKEKEMLWTEIFSLKRYLRKGMDRLSRLFSKYEMVRKEAKEMKTKISLLKAENEELLEKEKEIEAENEFLKAKLFSIQEVKKAVQEVRKQAPKVMETMRDIVEQEEILQGNRGFLIKDGQPTLPARIKINVIPAPADKQ